MQPEDLHGAEAPAVPLGEHAGKAGGTTPRPKQRGRYRPDQPALVTRSEASVSSQMHHSFHPPTAVRALRRNSPMVPTNGTVLRSLRADILDR